MLGRHCAHRLASIAQPRAASERWPPTRIEDRLSAPGAERERSAGPGGREVSSPAPAPATMAQAATAPRRRLAQLPVPRSVVEKMARIIRILLCALALSAASRVGAGTLSAQPARRPAPRGRREPPPDRRHRRRQDRPLQRPALPRPRDQVRALRHGLGRALGRLGARRGHALDEGRPRPPHDRARHDRPLAQRDLAAGRRSTGIASTWRSARAACCRARRPTSRPSRRSARASRG